jgi:ribonuclease HI
MVTPLVSLKARMEDMANKKKFYAVAAGKKPGIYTEWAGENGAQAQVNGYPGSVYKGFPTIQEAEAFMKKAPKRRPAAKRPKAKPKPKLRSRPTTLLCAPDQTVVYTDGGARPTNPGPGGYGVVVIEGENRQELSGGFRLTTNNRMEILACITGLKALDAPTEVTLYSDSKYVVNGITKGWAAGWRSRGWIKSDKKPAINPDLWAQLLEQCEKHDVEFIWVKGHAGNPENERCDILATRAALSEDLPADTGYEDTMSD